MLAMRYKVIGKQALKLVLMAVSLGFAGFAGAATYSNAINESSWTTSATVFECRLVHAIPFYGSAVFRTRAGEVSGFYLKSRASRFSAGEATMLATPPVWRSAQEAEEIGRVKVKQGSYPLWLGAADTEKMLVELNQGRQIEFSREAWFRDKNAAPVRLAISNIGFRTAYRSYLSCLTGLLPANFDQLKRTVLLFSEGTVEEASGLSSTITRKLDKALELVKHDNKIRRFYVDGHTSSEGDRAENLEISKMRAELVADYLSRRGVPDDWLVVRWHGERYPAVSNATAAGRAKNRRVTLRLEKVEEIEVLPLASAN